MGFGIGGPGFFVEGLLAGRSLGFGRLLGLGSRSVVDGEVDFLGLWSSRLGVRGGWDVGLGPLALIIFWLRSRVVRCRLNMRDWGSGVFVDRPGPLRRSTRLIGSGSEILALVSCYHGWRWMATRTKICWL